MRRALTSIVVLAVSAAVVALPATAARAIDPPRVRVLPGVSTVFLGGTRQLSAAVTNLGTTEVTWSVRTGPATGSVDATGLFTPPAQVPPQATAVVRATSVEDATVYGEATVAIGSGLAGGGFGAARDVLGGSYDVQTGDVTGDGVADVVQLQLPTHNLAAWQLVTQTSDGAGGFTSSTSAFTYLGQNINDFAGDLALGDVDGDGDLDAMVAIEAMNSSPINRYRLYRNNGTGTFTADPVSTATTSEGRSGARLRLVDFDGDGDLDAVRLDRFGTVVLQKGDGTGAFAPGTHLFSVSGGRFLAVGDLTGDGRPEVAVGRLTTSFVETTFDVAVNDGFGAIAGQTTYTAGLNAEPFVMDVTGDGWNDLLVGIGSEGATHHPPRLVAFPNLATGTGALGTTATPVFDFRPQDVRPAHLDADPGLDFAAVTHRGPLFARRTGPSAFTAVHAAAVFPHEAGVADVTGDGRVDMFVSSDEQSRFWPGAADATFELAVDPTVSRVNATLTAEFSASARNVPVPVALQWSATRGTFSTSTYSAPATAAPSGTPVRVTAALTGTAATATRDITVVNEKLQFTSLGAQHVRHVVADPTQANVLYAATGSGVYRSLNGGATFALLGTTATTGVDARQLTVVRHAESGTARLLAVFGSTAYRYDLVAGGDWVPAGAPAGVTALSAVRDSLVVWAAAGQVARSVDGGASWTGHGGTAVADVEAVTDTTFWAARTAAPRVSLGTFADGAVTLAARETPAGTGVLTIAVDPDEPTTAYVSTADSTAGRMFRGDAASGTWTALPVPGLVDRISVAPTGAVLAARSGTTGIWKSVDSGAAWYSLNRGFPNGTAVQSVGHRLDGLDLVGTAAGLYTPVETVPPDVPTVTAGPAGVTGPGAAGSFSFTFTPTGSTHVCALDGAAWAACTSPKTYNGPLASGSHTFSVVAVDDNGNESAPGTHTWTVDATPPALPENLTGPSGLVRSTSAQFTFSLAEDAVGATCALDGATPTSCASGVTYPSLGQGAHTFAVRSVDAYGNTSAPVTRSWTVDTTPPAYPQLWNYPSGSSPTPNPIFLWYVDDTATYTCELDDVPVPCSPGSYAASGLSHGEHVFSVTASDAAGNSVTNSHWWIVDLVDPEAPTFSVGPPATTNATTAHFEFASPSTDVQYYWCRLDGMTSACYGDFDATNLSATAHTLEVWAIDFAGRHSPMTAYAWTVSAEPPPAAPTILTGPTGLVRSRTATFVFRVPDGTTPMCSLDGATPVICASGVTYDDLGDGPHTFAVHAASGSGVASSPATRAWTVDATPPAAPTLLDAPAARTAETTAAFDWEPDGALTYACALDGVPAACGEGGSFAAADLGDGTHQFVLTAADAAGNTAERAHAWTVDTTGPGVAFSAKPAALTKQTTAAFAWSSAATDVDHFECVVDGGATDEDCGTTLDLGPLAPGAHTLTVVGVDDLGNAGPAAAYTWTVDTTAPTVTIAAPPAVLNPGILVTATEPVANATTGTVRLLLTGTTTGVAASLSCRTAANAVVSCAAPTVTRMVLTPVAPLVPGQLYTVSAAGLTDRAGNAAAARSLAFRASTVEQETSLAGRQSWRRLGWAGAQGGSYHVAHQRGATASFTFTGTSVTWFGVRGPTYGLADVYVDNVLKASRVNFYSPSVGALTRTITGLTNARHTLRIVVRGERGSTAGRGTDVAVDAFRVGAATYATPAVAFTWARNGAAAASGGAYLVEDYAGATYTFTFRGRGVDWVSAVGPNMGLATVHVDGVLKGTFDNWSSTTRYNVGRSFTGLTDRVHTVTITVLGRRRSGATGSYVVVDRFGVRP